MMMKKIISLMVILLMSSVLVSATFGGQYHSADDILWSKTNEEGSYGSFTSNTSIQDSLTYFFPLALSFGGSMFFGSDIYVYGNAKTLTEQTGTLGWQRGVTGIFNTGDVNVTVNKGLITGLSGSDKGGCSSDLDCAGATCIEGSTYGAYDLLKGAESCVGGVCVASPLTAVCPYGCKSGACDTPVNCSGGCTKLSSGKYVYTAPSEPDYQNRCAVSGVYCEYGCSNSGCNTNNGVSGNTCTNGTCNA